MCYSPDLLTILFTIPFHTLHGVPLEFTQCRNIPISSQFFVSIIREAIFSCTLIHVHFFVESLGLWRICHYTRSTEVWYHHAKIYCKVEDFRQFEWKSLGMNENFWKKKPSPRRWICSKNNRLIWIQLGIHIEFPITFDWIKEFTWIQSNTINYLFNSIT